MKKYQSQMNQSYFRKVRDTIRNSGHKLVIIVLGITAAIWFLVRVIPKPSRASYPCQQAAFPLVSG